METPVSMASGSATNENSSEDGIGRAIAPDPRRFDAIAAQSLRYWTALAKKAASTSMDHGTVQLEHHVSRMPALPDNLTGISALLGYATWELRDGCKVGEASRDGEERRWWLAPPSSKPTLCSVSSQRSFLYPETELNGLTLMFFGWAYILCANLIEKQSLQVHYADLDNDLSQENGQEENGGKQAQNVQDQFTTVVEIDIGKSSTHEWRWWKSLVAAGQGWGPKNTPRPPWIIEYTGNVRFQITTDLSDNIDPATCTPASSQQAFQYLKKFASTYNIGDQCSLALAMALSLPVHNKTQASLELPAVSSFRNSSMKPSPVPNIQRDFNNIKYYMTLSSNAQYMSSTLWSIFWEPDIDCNLVSAWYEPIIQVITPLIQGGKCETLAHLFAYRCPRIAPLWYGALACGQSKIFHKIISFLQTSMTPTFSRPMEEVAAWTGSAHSFMDIHGSGSGPYLSGDQVTRADVWRLRHEFWGDNPDGLPFKNIPSSPWQPFGTMKDKDTEIPVRVHLGCERHEWAYAKWTWLLDDKEYPDHATDLGMDSPVTYNTQYWISSLDEDLKPAVAKSGSADKIVLGDTFRWAATEMELSGKEIYTHPWVRAHLHIYQDWEEESELADYKDKEDFQRRTEDWLEGLPDMNSLTLNGIEV